MEKIIFLVLAIPILAFVLYLGGSAIMKGFNAKAANRSEKEEENEKNLTIRETFAKHRENPDCAGCHSRIDPLGFALENFDITGRWRDKYENGRDVDMSGKLVRKHDFKSIVEFKKSLSKENKRIAKAFIGHLLRFSLSRELSPSDSLVIDRILEETEKDNFKIQALIRAVILSERFLQS